MAAVGLALWPSRALADAGVPMLVFVWPASWILLAPIVFVEAAIACRVLVLPFGRCLKISMVANLVSTVLGIPLAWLGAFILQMLLALIGVGLQTVTRGYIPESVLAIQILAPAWLGPGEAKPWVFPASAFALCVPFFFASVYCERWVGRKMVLPALHDQVRQWSWRANLISYGAIMVLLVALTIYLVLR